MLLMNVIFWTLVIVLAVLAFTLFAVAGYFWFCWMIQIVDVIEKWNFKRKANRAVKNFWGRK